MQGRSLKGQKTLCIRVFLFRDQLHTAYKDELSIRFAVRGIKYIYDIFILPILHWLRAESTICNSIGLDSLPATRFPVNCRSALEGCLSSRIFFSFVWIYCFILILADKVLHSCKRTINLMLKKMKNSIWSLLFWMHNNFFYWIKTCSLFFQHFPLLCWLKSVWITVVLHLENEIKRKYSFFLFQVTCRPNSLSPHKSAHLHIQNSLRLPSMTRSNIRRMSFLLSTPSPMRSFKGER